MLDRDRIIAASKTLSDHWRAGTKLAGLDASCRPRDRAEGYAIQAEIEQTSSGKLFGWKIAATSEAGQKHINVEGPMAGRILSETVIADGGTASMAGNEMRGRQFIGHGKNVLGDPRVALVWCANELRQLGLTLRAGEVVTTGTYHPPLPIQSGDLVAADFGSLGRVSVAFT